MNKMQQRTKLIAPKLPTTPAAEPQSTADKMRVLRRMGKYLFRYPKTVLLALLLMLVWELSFRLHPERFFEETNACLSCSHCQEKLCHHKKQLRSFLKKHKFVRK